MGAQGGSNAGSYLAAGGITQGIGAIGGAISQASAMRAQGDYQKSMSDLNARIAGIEAKDAVSRGDTAAMQYKKNVAKVIGAQRSSYAAQGVNVDSGSASDIQDQTSLQAARDVNQIKSNSWREAWGYKVEAGNSSIAGTFAQNAAKFNASSTLLTGGLQGIGAGLTAYGQYNGFSPNKRGA